MSLEDYEILKPLGQGNYSTVFKVRYKPNDSYFAMKEIKFDRLSPKEKEYTKTEVKILKQIRHPNIIKFERSFSEGNNFYIIMELATHGDLQEKINSYDSKSFTFPLDMIWSYTYQITSGLKALHDNKILHRDIKASNIFLMQDDLVKIGDFNIGKEFIQTLILTKIGTPVTMSPEAWNGEAYNYKTDIWSLGCLVYHMAALKLPFEAENYAALYMKISKLKYEKLKNYPKALNLFIDKLLKKKPKQRPSCAEILQFEEFKKFRELEVQEKETEEKKEIKVKNVFCKPKSMPQDISKEPFSLRKKSKKECSPIPIGKLIIHRDTRSCHKDSVSPDMPFSMNATPTTMSHLTPTPKLNHQKLTQKAKLLHDRSLNIFGSFDLASKKKNSLFHIITPKYTLKFERTAAREIFSNSPYRAENSPRLHSIVTQCNKNFYETRLKRQPANISSQLLTNKIGVLRRKRNTGSLHIQKKPTLKKVASAKKFSLPSNVNFRLNN